MQTSEGSPATPAAQVLQHVGTVGNTQLNGAVARPMRGLDTAIVIIPMIGSNTSLICILRGYASYRNLVCSEDRFKQETKDSE